MSARCAILWLLLLIGGCSHGPRRVDCDGHLQPINPPTPVVKDAPARTPP